MKRLHRRVENSESNGASGSNPSVSKTRTFDRRTFFECSTRMKRIVPTLGRQETDLKSVTGSHDVLSQVNSERLTCRKDEDDDFTLIPDHYNDTHDSNSTDMDMEGPFITSDEERPHQTNSNRNPENLLMLTKGHSSKIVSNELKMGTCVTLPRNMEKISTIVDATRVVEGSSATLPSTSNPIQRHSSRRRLWMKPVTNFVSFMSKIGDNIQITSYPTQ